MDKNLVKKIIVSDEVFELSGTFPVFTASSLRRGWLDVSKHRYGRPLHTKLLLD